MSTVSTNITEEQLSKVVEEYRTIQEFLATMLSMILSPERPLIRTNRFSRDLKKVPDGVKHEAYRIATLIRIFLLRLSKK